MIANLSSLPRKFGDVFLMRLGRGIQAHGSWRAGEQLGEVLARELPLERLCKGFVVFLEVHKPFLKLNQRGQVVRRQHLALDDREVDPDLVEPAGMHGRVDRNDRGPALLQALDTSLAAMRRAIVHDPEDADRVPGRGV